MNKVLKAVDGFVENSDRALDMIESVEKSILKEQTNRLVSRRRSSDPLVAVCNADDQVWKNAAVDQVELRFEVAPTTLCLTDLVPEGKRESDLHDVVRKFNRHIYDHAEEIAREANTNFTHADAILDFPHVTTTEKCRVNVLGAYRLDKVWYLNVGITNEKKEKHLGEFKRHYLVEILSRGGGYGLMKVAERDANHRTRNDTTTIMVSHRGTAEPAVYKAVFLDDNIAVQRAVGKAISYTQQSTEALSPSSLTILLFPLCLNLVPIAMLADVSTAKMLLYALLSDVLTVLPLAIKGIELISIGSSRYVGSVVRMTTNMNGTRAKAAAAEVYVSQCEVKRNLVAIGATFVTIALAFLVGGVLAEFAARRYKERRRKRLYREMMNCGSSCRTSSQGRSSDMSRSSGSRDGEASRYLSVEVESYEQYEKEYHGL
ncbi:hypothetical protein BWQ96_07158 [Gracilariopsis chorda]|uniref:Uncharacterized protein n=1 Tax=Gracilariopsis chorda TaxID=448386 RepID=A0A2V3IM12_9FLOR|nr:hypothetical protein BWQ96_07158 [Gracilariopsis chorda]|eukprot:PXF43124.1 hypothetical protein BWQ96_07158 [Gracilariopsis chorda]